MHMREYVRNQEVVRKFFPKWNEERVRDLAVQKEILDEIEAISHLLEWTSDDIRILAKTDDDLFRVDYAIHVLEGAAGEKSILPEREPPDLPNLTF